MPRRDSEDPAVTNNKKQWAALFSMAGTTTFIAGWIILGFQLHNYSPRTEPISELARVGNGTHIAMTLIFIFFSISSIVYSSVLREYTKKGAIAIFFHGIGGLGAAAFPLGKYSSDVTHEFFAAMVYISIAIFPLFTTFPDGIFNDRRKRRLSIGVYIVISVALIISTFGPPATFGLLQRVGLTLGDLWLLWSARHVLQIISRDRIASAEIENHRLRELVKDEI